MSEWDLTNVRAINPERVTADEVRASHVAIEEAIGERWACGIEKPKVLRKLARSTMPSWKTGQIRKQGGVCPLSLKPFDLKDSKNAVVDHDHNTGEIRGVLSRSSNAAEGKVRAAVARWGGTGDNDPAILAWLKRLILYLEKPGLGLMYHTHLTEDEKRLKRNADARKVRAAKSARVAVKARGKPSGV